MGLQLVILDSADEIIAFPGSGFLLQTAGRAFLRDISEVSMTRVIRRSGARQMMRNGSIHTFTVADISWQLVVSRPTSAAFATQIILRCIVQIAAVTFLLIGLFFWVTLTLRGIGPIELLTPISESIGLNQPISEAEQQHLFSQ